MIFTNVPLFLSSEVRVSILFEQNLGVQDIRMMVDLCSKYLSNLSLQQITYIIYIYYTVLQKHAYTGLKQNILRSITLDIITRLLDNAAYVCIHVVE